MVFCAVPEALTQVCHMRKALLMEMRKCKNACEYDLNQSEEKP